MYSQQELDDAIAAGVISAADADALRVYIEQQRSTAIPDEEQFRLLTGFNDIFVSIAAAILLFAVGWIGQSIGQSTGLLILDRSGSGGPVRASSRRSRLRPRHGRSRSSSPPNGAWRFRRYSCFSRSSAGCLRLPIPARSDHWP